MKKRLGLVILIFCVMTMVYADRPLLVLSLQHDKDIGSLHIISTTEWNRNDLDEEKRDALAKKGIFYRKPKGNKVIQRYVLGGKNIRVEMVFPKQEYGRGLNESTRVELSLLEGNNLLFQSSNFGQHSEENTTKPKSGIKFRPNQLSIYKTDKLRFKVSGVYGKRFYTDGLGFGKGLTFDHCINGIVVDETFMNDLVSRMNKSSSNNPDAEDCK